MISRRTSLLLGSIYQVLFSHSSNHQTWSAPHQAELYDFLYAHSYEATFCNQARSAELHGTYGREVKDWIMQLHTGGALVSLTPDYGWEQREQLGQQYLQKLARDVIGYILQNSSSLRYGFGTTYEELIRSLELDGYTYRDGQLLFSESAVLDTAEESGVLQSLYFELDLNNRQVVLHHLELSEQNYVAGHWNDVISNARSFLEHVLLETARKHSLIVKQVPFSKAQPREIRDYLESSGLLEKKEKEALEKVYGLLSHTGSHPYIAEKDQARLMRILALTFSQFVMLRLKGALMEHSDE